jgi:hypothetical protein
MKFEDVKPGMAVFVNENDEEAIGFITDKTQEKLEFLIYIRPDKEFEKDFLRRENFESYFKSWRSIWKMPEVIRDTIKEIFEDEI